jgi:regulator of replication initiation timing
MFAKTVFVGLAAISVGANVYQFLTNRGLNKMLKDAGVSTEDKCKVLKKAMEDLDGQYTGLKKSLGDLIDEVAAGKVPNEQIGDRLMELYRAAHKEAPAADEPAPKSDPQAEAPSQSTSESTEQK